MWIYNFFNTFYNISPIFLERLKNMDFDKKRPSYYNMSKIYSPIALLSECDYIIDNIYLGSSVNAADKDLLDKNNIGYILNITNVIPNFYESDLKYFNIKINDNGEESFLKEDFERSYKFIIDLEKEDNNNNDNDNNDNNNRKNILIHCVFGRSRSVAILVYYIMRKHGMTIERALDYVKFRRYCINPSSRFIEDLKSILF